MTLYEMLNCEIKRMVTGIGHHNKGNIHPLIMHEIETYIIQIVLSETNYNYLAASKMLGISRSTLYRKIENLKINLLPPQERSSKLR